MSEAFEALLDELVADPDVAPGMIFGHRAAKLGKRVFCTGFEEDLVAKLGAERVQDLIATGAATAFDPMGGRPMTAWAQIPPPDGDPVAGWLVYAEEAKQFVASQDG